MSCHHIPVESSFIKSIGHDPEQNLLEVTMKNGKTYGYENVTEEQFDEFTQAKSIGKHYNEHYAGRGI